jgi:hypothetical protein
MKARKKNNLKNDWKGFSSCVDEGNLKTVQNNATKKKYHKSIIHQNGKGLLEHPH